MLPASVFYAKIKIMKLISLTTWGCRVTDPIFKYIKENSETTDIFCFQEILKGGNGKTSREEIKSAYEDIAKLLPNHTGYFREYGEGGYYAENYKNLDFKYGIACFVRSSLKQSFIDAFRLYDIGRKWNDYSGIFAVGLALAIKVEDYVIVNVHGLWQGHIKTDTEAKIEQSERIINIAQKTDGKKIIIGDFNLLPDTKSIGILRDKYVDLIQKFKIENTRSSLYYGNMKSADYAFIDKDIIVNNFSVPNLDISDHLPLLLEFK